MKYVKDFVLAMLGLALSLYLAVVIVMAGWYVLELREGAMMLWTFAGALIASMPYIAVREATR